MSKAQLSDYPAGATEFPLGFWNYVKIEQQDASAVGDWADIGSTLTMSPEYGPEPESIKRMKEILDAAAARGIRLIMCDSRTRWSTLTKEGEAGYRRGFAQALEQFGKHPAVFGFHVGDEPVAKDFADACLAMRILKEMAPGLKPFCNLFPHHPGCDKAVGYMNWGSYLDAFAAQAKPDFLCYDCYAQMNPGTEGFEIYFQNLREYREAAGRAGIPFWTTLLSVGHFRYRCPTENDLRWQLNTAVAHGAQGILYFFLYMRAPHDNYRVSPVDEHWERSETFEWLSRVNRSFLKGPASTVRQLTLKKVSHAGKAWGGIGLLDGTGLVRHAKSPHGNPLVISEFRHANGADYVMVVNNSQTDSTQVELCVSGLSPVLHRVDWLGEEKAVTRGDGWSAEHGSDFMIVRPWLAPGQMELYRVTQKV